MGSRYKETAENKAETYRVYGEHLFSACDAVDALRFAKESDYGFRDYSPTHARFITEDPIRDGENWFAYVGNNPVNWVDPDGREQVYFIYTYKNTEYDQKKMKARERNSINDDISWLEKKVYLLKF